MKSVARAVRNTVRGRLGPHLKQLQVELIRSLGIRYLNRGSAPLIELDIGRFPYMGFGASIGWILPAYIACERLSADLAILNPDRWPFGGGRPECSLDRFIDLPDATVRRGTPSDDALPFVVSDWAELARWGYNDDLTDPACVFGYKPAGCDSLDDYRSKIVRHIYRPTEFSRRSIDAGIAFTPQRYLAWHVRRGDKTSGPTKEDDPVPLQQYVRRTAALLDENPQLPSAFVVCSDSPASIEEAMDLGAKELRGVRIIADATEQRWDGYCLLHRTGQISDADVMVGEILSAQKNLEILRRSEYLIGCNSSCLFRIASFLRPDLAGVTSFSENKKWKKYYPI